MYAEVFINTQSKNPVTNKKSSIKIWQCNQQWVTTFGLGGSNSLKAYLKTEHKILEVKPDAIDKARASQENANV